MAIDFTKPAITDNYSSEFVPNILTNFTALGRWLDTRNESVTGTPPTYTKRYNSSTQRLEEYTGASWASLSLAYVLKAGDSLTGGLNIQPASGPALSIRGATATNSQAYWQSDNGAGSAFWISSTASLFKIGGNGGTDPALHPLQINNSGNVSINSPASGVAFHVSGLGGATSAFSVSPVGTTADTGYNGNISSTRPAVSAQHINMIRSGLMAWSLGYVYNTDSFAIGVGLNTDSAFTNPAFRISAAGNVTIAAPSSGNALTVNHLPGTGAIVFSDGTVVQSLFTSGAQSYFGTDSAHPLNFLTTNATRLSIGAAGNVVINEPSSGIPLETTSGTTGAKLFKCNATGGTSLYGYSDSGGSGITNADPYSSGSLLYLNGTTMTFYTAGVNQGSVSSTGVLTLTGTTDTSLGTIESTGYARLGSTSIGDLNLFSTTIQAGRFRYDAYGGTALNRPVTLNNANGVISFVTHGNGGAGIYGKQIAFGDSDEAYMRSITNGSYQSWYRILNSGAAGLATEAANIGGAFGAARVNGSKGGYGGIRDTYSGVNFGMHDSSANGGTYHEPSGTWHFYWNQANLCLSIGGSTTDSNYAMYLNNKGLFVASGAVRLQNGNLTRGAAHIGHLEGSYNNVGPNDAYTNPIYTIGSSYNPGSTVLSNMYGIGYSNSSASFAPATASGWGQYVCGGGVARIWLGGDTGQISATGNIIAYASDERLKKNVTTITDPLEKIMQIKGVTYDWIDDIKDYDFHPTHMHETGVIAQDIQKVIPDAVSIAPFNNGATAKKGIDNEYLTVDKEKIIPLLIESTKALLTRIEQLEARQ